MRPLSVVLGLTSRPTAVVIGLVALVLAPLAPPARADAAPPPPELARVAVPLPAWLASRPHRGPDSIDDLAHEPTQERSLHSALRATIAQDWSTARHAATQGGFELLALVDGARWYAVLQPAAEGLGPTVVAAPHLWRDPIAEAPHARFERGTAEEVALLVTELGARAGLIAGAHRCAARRRSACSGTTRVFGEAADAPYRTSDVGHNPATLFHAAHEVLAAAWPEAVVLSLHGMRRTDATRVIVSDGSREQRPGDRGRSGRLRDALRARLGEGPAVVSCNDPNDDGYPYRRLCGVTNVQGRSLNGSPNACGVSAEAPSGRFLHLEQTWDVLGEFERGWAGWAGYANLSAILHATMAVMPCTAADCPR
jgi:hypothetical protein